MLGRVLVPATKNAPSAELDESELFQFANRVLGAFAVVLRDRGTSRIRRRIVTGLLPQIRLVGHFGEPLHEIVSRHVRPPIRSRGRRLQAYCFTLAYFLAIFATVRSGFSRESALTVFWVTGPRAGSDTVRIVQVPFCCPLTFAMLPLALAFPRQYSLTHRQDVVELFVLEQSIEAICLAVYRDVNGEAAANLPARSQRDG